MVRSRTGVPMEAECFSVEFCRDGRIVPSGRDRVTKLWDQNGGALRGFEEFRDLRPCRQPTVMKPTV